MKRKLTAQFVKHAPAPTTKSKEIYWDESLRGFGLAVTNSGHKSWVIQYRMRGKTRRITLKQRGFSLEEARGKAHDTLGKVARGEDPATKTAKDPTFGEVAESYLRIKGKKLRSAALYRRTLERLVVPQLGKLPISKIERLQIANLLDAIVEENGEVMADLTLAIIRRVMSWHATRDSHFASPIVRGMARSKPSERARSRILDDDEIRRVWKAADASTGILGPFVRFLLLTACRRDEAAD